jgi:hypothetical protein
MVSSRATSPGVRRTGRATLASHSARMSSARWTVAWLTRASRARWNYIKIMLEDRVLVELPPYDLTRGRIVSRYRN